jgi:putative nucleotidyltransferase with HDIG domain
VYLNLARGETIVPDGQYITALSLEKLRAAGLLNPAFGWERLAGDALLALLGAGVLALYLLVAKPEPMRDLRGLLLLGLVVVGTVAAAKFALPGRPVWAVAFPLAASAMLLTAMLHLSTALPATALLALLTTYAADFSQGTPTAVTLTPVDTLSKLALYLTTGSVAALVVWRAQRIAQYFVAGGASAAAGLLVVLAFWLLAPQRDVTELPWLGLAALGSGVLSAALALGFFIMLGAVLGLTTRVQLHELAQADHPLLKQLLQEAPGTYYHSLLVGNLAEQACEAIGADALLARVGAYYHDVGKIRNPGFFIENQRRGENIHDRLDPLTSASVVIAHVRDGLGMARGARLPRRLHDFIEEHHGNRLAVAFYNKATHLNAKVNPEMFRYPGPPPRSRETAVVMLADSLEAISRSGGGQTPPELEALVDRVIAERTAEGQLVDCELTLGDVERIRAVFKTALTGIYHPRVQYPTPAGLDVNPAEAARRLAVVGDQQPGDFC